MFADLMLPRGFTVRITLDPAKAPLSANVAVLFDGEWIGDASIVPYRLDRPGDLQEVVDMMTKRGVHR